MLFLVLFYVIEIDNVFALKLLKMHKVMFAKEIYVELKSMFLKQKRAF